MSGGKNRIDVKFAALRKKKEGALIAYIMAGDPDIKTTLSYALALEKAGADIIELGIPFSDPVADGPTIQRAGIRALSKKTTPGDVFELAKSIRKKSEIPLIFMTYYNIVYNGGSENEASFIKRMKEAGVDGIIVPDMPVEESAPIASACEKYGVANILLASPASGEERIRKIAGRCTGFLYVVSTFGVTGARKSMDAGTANLVKKMKKNAGKRPVAVGFGISKPEHVASVIGAGADAAVVGSAIVAMVERKAHMGEFIDYVKKLKEAAKKA